MSNELAPVSSLGKYALAENFEKVSSTGGFLPRIQLFGSNSEAVKESKIGLAHYGLVRGKDQIEDLGNEVNLILLSWRPKALQLGEGGVTSAFDPRSELFRSIQLKSEEANSGRLCHLSK